MRKKQGRPKGKNRKTKTVCGEEYWTSAKAAEYLGVAKNTLYIYAQNGLSHIYLGNYILFKEEWLKEYVNERTHLTTYREANR